MKNKIFKRLSILFATSTMFFIATPNTISYASTCEYEKEIVICEDVSEDKSKLIYNAITGENNHDLISPYGIFCLFGHKLSYTKAYEINHNYYSTSPKCRSIEYDVTYCTRSSCDYIVYKQNLVTRISCH